jgi:hypothetical protein
MTEAQIEDVGEALNRRVPKKYHEGAPHPRPIGRPFFTGFKTNVPAQNLSEEENAKLVAAVEKPGDLGYVAQFVFYAKIAGGPFFYVNLPNMKGGRYEIGESFDIGEERVHCDISQRDLESMLEAGYKKICEISGVV